MRLRYASHEHFYPLEIGGEGGIRTHGADNRTTAFESKIFVLARAVQ